MGPDRIATTAEPRPGSGHRPEVCSQADLRLLAGASADWQIILPDGTTLGDVRYTLETEGGDVLCVQSQGVRHGSAAVLERLARGEDVDAGEYTFRTAVKIETGADSLDWLNKGIFVSVGGRQRGGVIYEVYLVG